MADEELLNYDDEQEDVSKVTSNNTTTTNNNNNNNNNTGAGAGGGGGASKKPGYAGLNSNSFKDFFLKPELLQAINVHGFEHPSEVQQECIPQAIVGTDVLCQAQSGMGKTAVFVLATLQQLDTSIENAVQVLVLCHTRELAFQIAKEYERFSQSMGNVKTQVVYGGVNITIHRNLFKNDVPQIVVGTPGRILQLVNEKVLKLDKVKHFVLDECDSLLGKDSLDMRKDIQDIFKMSPREKQVMMFTATLSADTRAVCRKFMIHPVEVIVDNESKLTLHGLQQHYIQLEEKEKNKKLMDILDSLDFNQVMIFVKSPLRAKALASILTEANFPARDLHSLMKQEERIQTFKDFKDSKFRILVSTNLSGRGIDVSKVNIVVNYDMPESADSYLHRVGRAGRFGTKGLGITFVSSDEDKQVLNAVQERFEVSITTMPATIDKHVYMNA